MPNQHNATEIAAKLLNNGYQPIPIPFGKKGPNTKGWQNKAFTEDDFHKDNNVGIRTGGDDGIYLLDIDVTDPDMASQVVARWESQFPNCMQRTGKAPKTAFVFKSEPGHKKLKKKLDGNANAVEVLGDGQQFVGFGIHPDTQRPYTWGEFDPLDELFCHAEDITEVLWSDVVEFLDKIAEEFGGTPSLSLSQRAQSPLPSPDVRTAPGHATNTQPTRSEVEEVLGYINPDVGYDEWLNVLMGLHSLYEDYLSLADDWSSKGSKYHQGEVASKWKGFSANGGVTWGTVCKIAKNHGADLSEISRKHRGITEARVSLDDFDHFELGQSNFVIPKEEIVPTLFKLRPANEIPPRQWLFGKHLIRGFLSLTVAPGGLGKSSMLLVEALAMATGKPLLKTEPPMPLKVWVWNGEDPHEEIERRIAAASIHYDISSEDIGERLLVDSGRDVPITLAEYGGGTVKIATPTAERLEKAIRDAGVDVLIVDPFVTSHQVPENDTTAMNAVVATWRKIADATGCAIELVHHVSKHGALNADDVGIYSARGAGALIDGVRSARQLIRMKESEAERFGVEDATSYFRTVVGKANLAPAEKAEWRQMIGVQLKNGRDWWEQGDTVGVCTPWTPPDAFEGVTASDLQKVQHAIEACEKPPADSERAANWIGYLIAEQLDLDVAPDTKKEERTFSQNSARARVRTLVKTWLANNALTMVEIKDTRNGRPQKVIDVGDPVTAKDLGK